MTTELDENKGNKKEFVLSAEEIKPLVENIGWCLATDMITREGLGVNFMYREKPDRPDDSGWRFFSGLESDEYANDPTNSNIYFVNTIANYQPDIIPFLNAPLGSAFERNKESGKLEQIFDFKSPED